MSIGRAFLAYCEREIDFCDEEKGECGIAGSSAAIKTDESVAAASQRNTFMEDLPLEQRKQKKTV